MNLAPDDVRVGLPEDHESRVADHMVRRALLVAPLVLVLAALLGGRRSVVGALLGVIVVALNFLLASRLITWSARISPEAVSVAAIGDRKSTRLNSSHVALSRMPSSA